MNLQTPGTDHRLKQDRESYHLTIDSLRTSGSRNPARGSSMERRETLHSCPAAVLLFEQRAVVPAVAVGIYGS